MSSPGYEPCSVLLFIHGFPLSGAMWRAQQAEFAGRYTVLTPDLRGFGSSPLAGSPGTMAAYADDLAALLDASGIQVPVTVVGLSLGGYVAWEFWSRHSRRVGGLVLCNTRAVNDSAAAAAAREEMAQRVLREGTSFVPAAMLPRVLGTTSLHERPQIVAEITRQMQAASAEGIVAAQRGMAARRDFTPALGRLNVPVLGVGGEEDLLTPPAEMESWVRAIPRAEFVRLPQAGHLAPLENAEAFNAALHRFLAGKGRGAGLG